MLRDFNSLTRWGLDQHGPFSKGIKTKQARIGTNGKANDDEYTVGNNTFDPHVSPSPRKVASHRFANLLCSVEPPPPFIPDNLQPSDTFQ